MAFISRLTQYCTNKMFIYELGLQQFTKVPINIYCLDVNFVCLMFGGYILIKLNFVHFNNSFIEMKAVLTHHPYSYCSHVYEIE